MALSDDQRAMLRLLAQREQGYEDMAALMGLSVDEVRAKVKEALEEVDSATAPTPAPEPPAPKAPEPVEAAPPPAAPKPVEPAPAAPRPQVAPSPAAPTPPAAKPSRASRPKASFPAGRRSLVEWVGGGAIVVLIVLFITGAIDIGGGDSDSDNAPTTAGSTADGTNAAANSPQATKAILTPVDGGEGSGLALFGRIKKTAILQVEARDLEPTAKGESYTVWLYRSPKLALRVGAVAVTEEGTIEAQFPLPREVLEVVAAGAFDQVDISRTQNSDYEAEVAQAEKQKRLPAYSGEDVLRGKITGPSIKKR